MIETISEDEKRDTQKKKGIFRRFISYYKPHRLLFAADMFASFMISAIAMVYPIMTQKMLKTYIPNKDFAMIWILGVIVFGLYFLRMGFRFFVQFYGHVMGTKMQAQMRNDMFAHLEKLPYSYYDSHETGRIMSRMTNDLQDVSELAHHGPENLFISGFMLVATFAYLMTLNVFLTLIIFSVVPIVFFITVKLKKSMSSAFMESRRSIAMINSSLENSISGIRVTKAFTNSEEEQKKFAVSNQSFVAAKTKAYKAMGEFQSSTAFVTDLFNLIVLIAGALFMAQGAFSYDVLAAFIVAVNLFINPLTTLINFTEQFEDGVSGFRRFVTIMDESPEKDKDGAVVLTHAKGDIEFSHVNFHYGDGKMVLEDVSLTVRHGEKLALVGSSGGGKTTFCHLIPHFYTPESGTVSIDGISADKITMESLRENIGIVQQDVFLFDGTIKDNILYGKLDATDLEVVEAAKKARLEEFIASLPLGLNTQVGERGVRLSGGQKQRISIARIFLKNPAILILDEATSALDNVTEIQIQDALDDLCRGRTTLIVAHRLSTIRFVDRIAVIEEGKVKEIGTHDELMKIPDGIYQKLYNLQFRLDSK